MYQRLSFLLWTCNEEIQCLPVSVGVTVPKVPLVLSVIFIPPVQMSAQWKKQNLSIIMKIVLISRPSVKLRGFPRNPQTTIQHPLL